MVNKESIGIDNDLTKERNMNTFKTYCKRRKSGARFPDRKANNRLCACHCIAGNGCRLATTTQSWNHRARPYGHREWHTSTALPAPPSGRFPWQLYHQAAHHVRWVGKNKGYQQQPQQLPLPRSSPPPGSGRHSPPLPSPTSRRDSRHRELRPSFKSAPTPPPPPTPQTATSLTSCG